MLAWRHIETGPTRKMLIHPHPRLGIIYATFWSAAPRHSRSPEVWSQDFGVAASLEITQAAAHPGSQTECASAPPVSTPPSRRNLRFLALAARASTRFGKPSRRQKAPRRRPFHRLSDESGSHRVRARPPRARLGVKASRPMRLTTPKAALSDAPKFSAPTLLFPEGARFGGRGGMVRLRTKRTGHSRQVHQGHRIAFTGFVGKDNSSRYRKSFHDRDN